MKSIFSIENRRFHPEETLLYKEPNYVKNHIYCFEAKYKKCSEPLISWGGGNFKVSEVLELESDSKFYLTLRRIHLSFLCKVVFLFDIETLLQRHFLREHSKSTNSHWICYLNQVINL